MLARAIYPNDYKQRTVASCRGILDDIKPCFLAEMKVRFIAGVPHLIIVFEHPNLEAKPACAVRLVTISRSNPLAPGNPLEGDRLKRVVRTAVETYLHKHGIRIPTPQFELRSQ